MEALILEKGSSGVLIRVCRRLAAAASILARVRKRKGRLVHFTHLALILYLFSLAAPG